MNAEIMHRLKLINGNSWGVSNYKYESDAEEGVINKTCLSCSLNLSFILDSQQLSRRERDTLEDIQKDCEDLSACPWMFDYTSLLVMKFEMEEGRRCLKSNI